MNISKFNFAEMCSNNSGKTSMASVMGGFLCLVSGICFVFGCFTHNSEIITNSTLNIGIGSSLILGKKIVDGRLPVKENDETKVVEDTKVDVPENG